MHSAFTDYSCVCTCVAQLSWVTCAVRNSGYLAACQTASKATMCCSTLLHLYACESPRRDAKRSWKSHISCYHTTAGCRLLGGCRLAWYHATHKGANHTGGCQTLRPTPQKQSTMPVPVADAASKHSSRQRRLGKLRVQAKNKAADHY